MQNIHDYEFSDEDDTSIITCMNFKLKFGVYKGYKLSEVVKSKKGRATLRYYTAWDNLRADARAAITAVLSDYEETKTAR